MKRGGFSVSGALSAQFFEVDTLVQRILEAGDIESLDHSAITRSRAPRACASSRLATIRSPAICD
jgi:FdhE protein